MIYLPTLQNIPDISDQDIYLGFCKHKNILITKKMYKEKCNIKNPHKPCKWFIHKGRTKRDT